MRSNAGMAKWTKGRRLALCASLCSQLALWLGLWQYSLLIKRNNSIHCKSKGVSPCGSTTFTARHQKE